MDSLVGLKEHAAQLTILPKWAAGV